MKPALLYFFLLFSAIRLFAQDGLPGADSVYGLQIQRYSQGQPSSKEKPYYISCGQKIRIRTHSNHHLKEGILTAFTDSSLVMDSATVFLFSDIWQISWYDQRIQNYGAGVMAFGWVTMIAGVGVLFSPFLIDNINQLTFDSVGFALVVGIPMVLGGAAIMAVGIGNVDKGKWHKKELSNYWRIGVSQLPANEKTGKVIRRKTNSKLHLP